MFIHSLAMVNVKSHNPDLQINSPQLISFLQIILLLIIVSNTFNFIQQKSPTSVSGEMKASGGCHRFSKETIGRRFSSPPSRMKTDSNLMRVYPFIILIIMNVTT
ncbi:hypothetical protein D5F11_024990, partial [Siminovitchia terrae]